MFQQLAPLLRQRSVLLTITCLEEDQIRVNVLPKKLADSENAALTTPMSFTGTAAELDPQLPDAIVSFVASHLELKNTLSRAKKEMAVDEASQAIRLNSKWPVARLVAQVYTDRLIPGITRGVGRGPLPHSEHERRPLAGCLRGRR
jgi:PRTRC genetic system protein E